MFCVARHVLKSMSPPLLPTRFHLETVGFFMLFSIFPNLKIRIYLEKIQLSPLNKADKGGCIMNCRSCFLIGSLFVQLTCHGIASAEMVSIKGDDINMRSGPGTNHPVLYTLGSGMPLDVINRSEDWLQIKDFEGDTGWVHQSMVSDNPTVIVKANKDSTAQINVRSGPGTKNKIVGKAFYGVVFRKLGEKNQWVEVEHDGGVKGWIDRSLLWGM